MIKPFDDWTKMSYEQWLEFLCDLDKDHFLRYSTTERAEVVEHVNRFMCTTCGIKWISRKLSSSRITARRKILGKHMDRLCKIHEESSDEIYKV